MLKKPQQFEPSTQLHQAFNELESSVQEMQSALDRVLWLKRKAIEEFEQVKTEADNLEIYTEAEAADMLKIKENHLADMRRRFDLPHCSFGNKPRYTKAQLIEICSMLELNARGRSAVGRAA